MRPTLAETAACLSALVEGMENKQDIKTLLRNEFADYLDNIQRDIDKRKSLLKEIEEKISLASELRENYSRQKRRFESIRDNLIEQTKDIIEKNPTLPWQDSLGKRIAVWRNAQPKLIIKDPELLPEEFCVIKKEVDKIKLKDALESNPKLAEQLGISLEYGTQLRGMTW